MRPRLGAVSYLNTRPLVFALERDGSPFALSYSVPSRCADDLACGAVDVGGVVPGSMAASAKTVWDEGLRIPPLRIWDRGKERRDVVNFILTNVRSRRLQAGDMRAQLAAVTIGERNLIGLLDKYGKDTVMA